MAAPIVYSSQDFGSPGRNLTGNAQNRLKQILKACLVDGYGNKPGAGWSMVHEHENGFSMSNGFGVINFVSNISMFGRTLPSNTIGVALAEGVNDTSGALVGADNIKSGYSDNSNFTHTIPFRAAVSELSTLNWSVYATEKTAILVFFSLYSNTGCLFYFGEYDSHLGKDNFIALGGGTISSGNTINLSFRGGCTTLRNLGTGIIDTTYTEFFGLPYGFDKNQDKNHNASAGMVTSDYLDFSRIPIFSVDYGIVGKLYGALYSSIVYRSFELFNEMVGPSKSSEVAALPHDFNGELICTTYNLNGNGLVSDNVEYWS